jgi:hypothetical protein
MGNISFGFKRNQKGAIGEFIGLIFFLTVVLGILVPFIIELLAYTGQAQEVDRLTKLAARRACTLLANPNIGVAGDLRQGAIGVGTDVSVMQPLVNQIFANEAAHPLRYFENVPQPNQQNPLRGDIEFHLFDFTGQEIDIKGNTNRVTVEDSEGRTAEVLLVGTNAEASLCPAGGDRTGQQGWKYCMSAQGDQAAKDALRGAGNGNNADLVQRMEKLQAGRCRPGDPNCRNDFRNRIDRCTVCARKTRESIFKGTLFGPALACNGANDRNKVFQCGIYTCATEKFTQLSAKRGYNVAYQDQKNLGSAYKAVEINPGERITQRTSISDAPTVVPNAYQNNQAPASNEVKYTKSDTAKNQNQKESTVKFFDTMGDQFDNSKQGQPK